MKPPGLTMDLQEIQVSMLNETGFQTLGDSTAFFNKDTEREEIKGVGGNLQTHANQSLHADLIWTLIQTYKLYQQGRTTFITFIRLLEI